MTGCPSREQLANLLSERTIDIEGFDLGEHTRTCATCRAIIKSLSQESSKSWSQEGSKSLSQEGSKSLSQEDSTSLSQEDSTSLSQEGSTDSGLDRFRDSFNRAPKAAVADDDPNTLADSGQTVETFVARPAPASSPDIASQSSAGSSSYETIDTAFRAPAVPSSSDTIDTAFRSPADEASMDTIDSPTSASVLRGRRASTAARGASSASSSSEDTQHAPFEPSGVTSEATLDFSQEGQSGLKKTVPGVSARPNLGAKHGPEDYEILGELGRGGMGIVYKARDRRLNRIVALKMIRGAVHADDIQVTRFRIEAEAVAALRHPNILQIYDIGESDGLPYVALELLEGGSLADKLRGTSLPPRKAAEWMVPMAMAMDAAHTAGIVHRDLKSVNILFTTDGVPKVTDFGLAKRLEVDEGHTHTGQVMGTPSYMAPEQARGDTKNVGPAADIYALGAILYEMLTGRPPFKGVSAMDTVKQVIEVEPVAPSRVQYKVPRDLETICLKCLQKEPRKRYATAKDMADDLNRYLVGEPIRARRISPRERAWKWTKRHPTIALASACAVLSLISLVGWGTLSWNQRREAERVALLHDNDLQKGTTRDLFDAQEFVSKNDLIGGQRKLASRVGLLDGEQAKSPELLDLFNQTKNKLAEIDRAISAEKGRQADARAKEAVQNRYRHFLDRRKETLFRDTKFSGLMLTTNLELTRKTAEEALAVFGTAGDDGGWTLGQLPASLSSEQQTEVKEGCYELLLVLAENIAAEDPTKVERALRVLDSADRLRPAHSRAFHMRKAACLALKGDKAGQARELASARQLPPATAFDYFLSGQQEYKENRHARAILDFESSLRLKPAQFWAKCLLGICYNQTVRYDGAKSSLTDCIETDPNFAWLYLLRAFASGQLGARYENLVKTSPGRESDLREAAKREFVEAEEDLQRALDRLKSAPDDDLQYVLLTNRGLIRFQRDELDLAAADYQEAIQLKKDRFEAHGELAHVYEKQGKTDMAVEQFTRAIAVKPNWSPLYRGRAKVLHASAENDASRRQAALADYEQSIRYETLTTDSVLAQDHTNRGVLLYADERFDDALAESELALKVDRRFADAHVLKVKSLLKLRRYDELFRSCDAALETGKKSAVLYEVRGQAHAARQNYPAAIRDYGEAIETRPRDPGLLAERGWAYLLIDSPRLAIPDFEAAIQFNPTDGALYTGRGAAHAARGEYAAAVADASKALKLGETSPRIIYNSARIYAIAAATMAKEVGEKGRQSRQLATTYEDTAVKLIRKAFERQPPEKRAAFWRDTVAPDPALKSIKRRIKFEDLVVTNK